MSLSYFYLQGRQLQSLECGRNPRPGKKGDENHVHFHESWGKKNNLIEHVFEFYMVFISRFLENFLAGYVRLIVFYTAIRNADMKRDDPAIVSVIFGFANLASQPPKWIKT